ncbi:RNA 2',3'-cyclic phosphodiesterase [Candidatus Tiddalikarchaeum anstoanum]|nr:RNA 2',3'-cyclic phosphodiesterase [Candidatus Tiddalikarchaeum anstoanum]
MRLFTAVEIPVNIRKKVQDLIDKYRKVEPCAKYVAYENIHITLKFLGDVGEKKVDNIIEELGKIKNKKFECRLGKIGGFPNTVHPKVVWVGLKEGADNLVNLYFGIDKATPGFSEELKPYHPHVTLFRCDGIVDKSIFGEQFESDSFKVENFLLMKSVLTPKGPVYSVVKSFKLA